MLAGIALAVAALVVLGAIMVGVNDTIVRNAVALRAGQVAVDGGPMEMHEAIGRATRWRTIALTNPDVRDALPRCRFPALLQAGESTHSIEVWAVDPELEPGYTPIEGCLRAGVYLEQETDLILGEAVAADLSLDVGDSVTIVTPAQHYERVVTGIYGTGVGTFDGTMAFIPLSGAEALKEPDVFYEGAFFLKPGADPDAAVDSLGATQESNESLSTWMDMLPEVAQLVDLNKFSMTIMILMVVIILGFGVSNALLISVMDRYRQFAVLKAIGVRPREVMAMIILEAFVMCLAAGLLGTALGIGGATAWGHVGLDLSRYTSYNPLFSTDSIVYPRITGAMTLTPQALALCAGILSAVWPAAVAGGRRVSRGMRDV